MNSFRLWALPLVLLMTLPAGGKLAAGSLEADAAAGARLFDGSSSYTGTAAEAGASAEGKARLLAALKTRVDIKDRGKPEEGAALEQILSRVLDSPTGRELAVKFLQEDARATLSFEEISGTQVFTINGKKTFRTSGGHAHTADNPPAVHLNSAYLEAKQEDAPGTLAHELFGHVLERRRAERHGVTDAYIFHENEEANAGLIGWTVHAELGNKIDNGWAWIYMDNPANYHRRLKSIMAYYAGTLSTEEMRDPLPVYQARLHETDALLLRLPVKKEQNENWLKIIDHLVAAHEKIMESFRTLKEEINAVLASIPADESRIKAIQDYLKRRIAGCAGAAGKAWLEKLGEQSQDEYFAEMREVMAEREKVLAGLMLGKTWESEQPPQHPGQVTKPQLEEMWRQEEASSCGWRP